MSLHNNDEVKWDPAKEKSLAGEWLQFLTSGVWRALIYSSFQLWKNTDYITASNRPPMYSCASKASKKYVCSRCGEAVESGSLHFCLEIVKRTDFQDTLKYTTCAKLLQCGWTGLTWRIRQAEHWWHRYRAENINPHRLSWNRSNLRMWPNCIYQDETHSDSCKPSQALTATSSCLDLLHVE